jgi:hypothetical protein
MILSRITKAIREQNWFAVAIEFVIVIAGVVIGFQITAWNAERASRALETELLGRLLAETEEALVYLDNGIDRAQGFFDRLEYATAIVHSGSLDGADRDRVIQGLGGTGYYPTITPPRAVQDELINSGRSAELRSDDVRSALASYNSELAFITGQLDYFRSDPFFIWRDYPELWRTVYDQDENDRNRSDPDLQAIIEHPVIPSRVTQSLRDQYVFIIYRGRARSAAFALCEALARELDTTCGAEGRIVDP